MNKRQGGSGGGMPDMAELMKSMGGGEGGMPDMNDMGGLEDLLGGGKKKR